MSGLPFIFLSYEIAQHLFALGAWMSRIEMSRIEIAGRLNEISRGLASISNGLISLTLYGSYGPEVI